MYVHIEYGSEQTQVRREGIYYQKLTTENGKLYKLFNAPALTSTQAR